MPRESNIGDGVDSVFTVTDNETKKEQTSTFVLCPAVEFEAFLVLENFFLTLKGSDKRKEPLRELIKQLQKHWASEIEDMLER